MKKRWSVAVTVQIRRRKIAFRIHFQYSSIPLFHDSIRRNKLKILTDLSENKKQFPYFEIPEFGNRMMRHAF